METVLKYLPVIVFYIKCFVSYFTFVRTNAKSNEYLTRLRHPEFRTYWGHKILLAAWDFTTKGTFYLIALYPEVPAQYGKENREYQGVSFDGTV